MNNIETPECDRMLAVRDQSQAIGEFIDWLNYEHEVFLARYEDLDDYSQPVLMTFHRNMNELLAEFFGIDLAKVEAEKRAILDSLHE